MRKSLFISFMLFSSISYAADNRLEFREVLSQEQCNTVPCESFPFSFDKQRQEENLFVNKEVILSNEDFKKMIVHRLSSAHETAGIEIILKKNSADRLLKRTQEKSDKRRFAFIHEGVVVWAPYQIYPIDDGRLKIFNKDIITIKDASRFVRSLGFEPVVYLNGVLVQDWLESDESERKIYSDHIVNGIRERGIPLSYSNEEYFKKLTNNIEQNSNGNVMTSLTQILYRIIEIEPKASEEIDRQNSEESIAHMKRVGVTPAVIDRIEKNGR